MEYRPLRLYFLFDAVLPPLFPQPAGGCSPLGSSPWVFAVPSGMGHTPDNRSFCVRPDSCLSDLFPPGSLGGGVSLFVTSVLFAFPGFFFVRFLLSHFFFGCSLGQVFLLSGFLQNVCLSGGCGLSSPLRLGVLSCPSPPLPLFFRNVRRSASVPTFPLCPV